jgi:hypothetical protein
MTRNILFFVFAIGISNHAFPQTRYFTKTGTIAFTAGTPVEDIDAINKSVTSIFDTSTGQIEFAVLIKGFEFKRGLMQEHFNENYLESEKFPKSIFKGRFDDVSKMSFQKDGSYPTTVTGILEIHNVKKEVRVSGTIIVEKGIISSTATFKVLLEDYGIKIPGAVKDKISPTADVKINCTYKTL